MKNRILQITGLVFLAIGITLGSSCKKTFPPRPEVKPTPAPNSGCNDRDSPNYDPNAEGNGDCQYVYVTSYEISYYPSQDNGSDWDFGFGSATNADLILNIGYNGEDVLIFQSTEKTNQNPGAPAIWQEPRQLKLRNEIYRWDLWDYDATSPNDPIASGTFNPLDELDNGNITLQSGGTQLVIHYIIK